VGERTEEVPAMGIVPEIGGIVLLGEVLWMRKVIVGAIPQMTTTATIVVTQVTTPLVVLSKCLLKLRHGFSVPPKRDKQCMFPTMLHQPIILTIFLPCWFSPYYIHFRI